MHIEIPADAEAKITNKLHAEVNTSSDVSTESDVSFSTESEVSRALLGDIVHWMKYARYLPAEGRRETYEETVTRNMQMHIQKFPELTDEIQEAFQFVYDRKVLPSLRSQQFAGEAIAVNPTRMFNCSYLPIDDPLAFSETMFLLLSGTGVGFSVQKNHVRQLPPVMKPRKSRRYLVSDSIEG